MPQENEPRAKGIPAQAGYVEPHAGLLTAPPKGQLLYKVMRVEDLLRSNAESYLHFNRIDAYRDFPSADRNDGAQTPADRPGNSEARFKSNPAFSAADYYDRARARIYACCFSLENSKMIWYEYGNGGERGKVCVVLDFSKLRERINQTIDRGNSALQYGGVRCVQIFSVNYGVVEYVEWDAHRANAERLPNPISYAHLKNISFRDEKELRVSLSALGVGKFVLNDGRKMEFPPSLHLDFDFKAAVADGTINQILYPVGFDKEFLRAKLAKLSVAIAE